MSRLRAPRARRTPISRVRSTTATSMMFMITMPPTPSDTEAISSDRMKAAARDLPPELLQALGGDDAEGIGGAEVGVAQRAHHRAHLVDRGVDARHAAPRLDQQVERVAACRTAGARPGWGRTTWRSRLSPSVRPCLASRPITR